MVVEWTWNDGIGSRGRLPAAIVILTDGRCARFSGVDVPGFARIVNKKFQKNGKWSNTTFSIVSPAGSRYIAWSQSFEEGVFFPQSTWAEALAWANSDGGLPAASPDAFEALVRLQWRKAAEHFDASAQALAGDI